MTFLLGVVLSIPIHRSDSVRRCGAPVGVALGDLGALAWNRIMSYASGTGVSIERSRAELEALLSRHGATAFSYARSETLGKVGIQFELKGYLVRYEIAIPTAKDADMRLSSMGRLRTPKQIENAVAKELRRRWRALVLIVRAKLVAIEDGISTMEREFMPSFVLPDDRTLEEVLAPNLQKMVGSGEISALMPGKATEARS